MVSQFVTARLAVASEVQGIATQSDICEHCEQRMVNPMSKDLRKFARISKINQRFLKIVQNFN